MATGRAGTHIRLLYDFEYQSPDGCQVKFAAGEECLLLKKTNPEWWYVLKKKEKRPLYVPANYVEQVETSEKPKKRAPPVPPPKPKLPKPSMEEEVLRELDSIINHALDEEIPVGDEDDDTPFYDKVTVGKSVDKPSTPEPDYEQGRSEDSSPSVPPLNIGMRAGSETSGYKTDSRESLDSPIPPNGADMYEAPQYANLASLNAEVQADSLSPTDDQPNYANLSDVQHSIHSGSLPESAVKREASDPGTSSADTVSLRKPVQVNSFGTPVFLTSDVSAEEETRIPEGWKEQKSQDGDVTYIHDHSDEKWHSATDGAGRQYFYKEGSSATSWSLPKVSNHPLLTRRHGSADNVPALVETPAPHVAQPLAPSLKRHQVRASWAAGETTLGAGWKRILPPNVPSISGPSLAVNELKEEEDEVEDRSISPLMSSTATKHLSLCFEEHSFKRSLRRIPFYGDGNSPVSALSTPEMLEKSGMLNKTRLTDSSGKKVKKNWSPSYVVAQGTELLFYKDQKAAQPKSGSSLGRPEAKLDLFGATVQIHIAAKDISSKKNFIHLVLLEGDQYLLQSEKDAFIQEWYNVLQHNTTTLAPITHSASMNSLEDSLESPKGTLDRATSLSPPDSKHARKGSKKNERPKTPDGDLSSAERNRIKMRLIKWLLRRPTMESLQEKGIIQDGVFGSHILTICEREKNNTPNFVTNCIKAIEARGLEVDGIYRVNGNAAQMQKLRYLVDQNQSYNLLDPEWDVHVITGALKLFFRELREPLIPFSFFNKFMDANKITDRVMKARSFKDLIKLLPHPNRETMRALFTHFVKVSEKSQKNLMQPHTLAIVYGPTLMWPAQESANMAITLVQQNQIIEICILDIKHIFT